jgi:hypothetical protein
VGEESYNNYAFNAFTWEKWIDKQLKNTKITITSILNDIQHLFMYYSGLFENWNNHAEDRQSHKSVFLKKHSKAEKNAKLPSGK